MSTPEQLSGVNNGFGPELSGELAALEHAFKIAETANPSVAKRGKNIVVCPASEILIGEKRIIEADGLSIGIYNIGGEFHAIKNVCPHAGAPLCEGHIQTTHRPGAVGEFEPAFEGRVLRCPWHGWEFDIITGKGLYDRNSRVATYKVEVDDAKNVVLFL